MKAYSFDIPVLENIFRYLTKELKQQKDQFVLPLMNLAINQ